MFANLIPFLDKQPDMSNDVLNRKLLGGHATLHNSFIIRMLGAGFEPARHCCQGILSLQKLIFNYKTLKATNLHLVT